MQTRTESGLGSTGSSTLQHNCGLDSEVDWAEITFQYALMGIGAKRDMQQTGPVCCTYHHVQEAGIGVGLVEAIGCHPDSASDPSDLHEDCLW